MQFAFLFKQMPFSSHKRQFGSQIHLLFSLKINSPKHSKQISSFTHYLQYGILNSHNMHLFSFKYLVSWHDKQ